MSVYLKHKTPIFMKTALLVFLLTDFSVNAASYSTGDNVSYDRFGLDINTSNPTSKEGNQKKEKEQVINNYQLVDALIKQKQFKQANEEVAALLKQNPKQSVYHNLKALLQLVDKDFIAAEQSYQAAIKLNSKNLTAYNGLANLALHHKHYSQADDYAKAILAINPYAINAYRVLADSALKQNNIGTAEKLLLDARIKVQDNIAAELGVLKLLGNVYISKKQPKKILSLATDLVKRNQKNISALSYLAGAQLINKDEQAAEKILRQIITQQPNDVQHHFLLAKLLSKQQDKETEIVKLLDTAALNTDKPTSILIYKTVILIRQKQFKQAFNVAKKVDKLNPTSILGKSLEGDIYLAQGNYKDALKSYQQGYQIIPNIKGLDAILKVLEILNKPEEALALLEKELVKRKESTTIQFRLARIYQKVGKNDLAIKYYELALSKQSDDPVGLNNLAWLYSQKNNLKALKTAEKAYRLAPKSAAIADTYGYILLKYGKKQDSLKVLQQAVRLNPNLLDSQLHLAESYIANGYKNEAKELLEYLISKQRLPKAIKLLEGL